MKNFWCFLCDFLGAIWGKNWRDFGKIFVWFLRKKYENLLYIFEKWQCDVSWIDASEISRSLYNESVNIGGYTYKLVKVHLTNLYIGIGSYKNSIILYYFKCCMSFYDIDRIFAFLTDFDWSTVNTTQRITIL